MNETERLLDFIEKAPTAFSAVDEIAKTLDENGYTRLSEGEEWCLKPGGYYLTRNGSSILSFRIPQEDASSFMIAASHSDSPTFKVKANAESDACGVYTKLNTEGYGGMLMPTWFDRPLSVAGRVIYRDGTKILSKSVIVDKDLLIIPSVAIHFDRTANDGKKYNAAVDTLPLYSMKGAAALKKTVADAAGIDEKDIIGDELFLYTRTKPVIFGADDAFFAAPRIDNLMCAYTSLQGFLAAESRGTVPVYAVFDNEETGSSTKQGAASMLMRDTLDRIAASIGKSLRTMLASSMMLSMDNGHAKHPNHPELSDGCNAPNMNGGVVLKYNAAQHYTTDGISAALFRQIADHAGVPVQVFANRSDMRGGSTLGSISDCMVPLCTVDIGAAQLAMHSAYETAGCADTAYLINVSRAFYETKLVAEGDGQFELLLK